MISWFVSLGPASGSLLSAQSPLQILCSLLSLPLPALSHSLSLMSIKINTVTVLKPFFAVNLALRDHCRSTVFINSKWSAVKWQEIRYNFELQDAKTREDHRGHALTLTEGEWRVVQRKGYDFSKVKQSIQERTLKSKWSRRSTLMTFSLYLCFSHINIFFKLLRIIKVYSLDAHLLNVATEG